MGGGVPLQLWGVWGVSPEKIFVELTPNGAILHTFEAILLSAEIFQLPSEVLSCQKILSVAKSICKLPKLDHLATNLQHCE